MNFTVYEYYGHMDELHGYVLVASGQENELEALKNHICCSCVKYYECSWCNPEDVDANYIIWTDGHIYINVA